MDVDRKEFLNSLGGADTVAAMDSEAKADALEDYLQKQLSVALHGPGP